MINLKQAIKENKVDQFIAEREGMVCDKKAFDTLLSKAIGRPPFKPKPKVKRERNKKPSRRPISISQQEFKAWSS